MKDRINKTLRNPNHGQLESDFAMTEEIGSIQPVTPV